MHIPFVNRELELGELDSARRHGGLLVVYGRRRVGKTRLLRRWLDAHDGLYSQAIEAPRDIQIQQVYEDLRSRLTTEVVPRTWTELFELLRVQSRPWTLCLDEFPYLVASDPTLPSVLQRWLDHSLPKGALVILSGSSLSMMHQLFLRAAAPLYGRARKLLLVRPMDYAAFARACRQPARLQESFEKFACVGGIPRYWEFLEPGQDLLELADALYFDLAPYMEHEPQRILRDEGVSGANAAAVLEAIGRGAERPSEISARLGTAQTNLSRVFQQLIDTSVLTREMPFGESIRSTRRVLYRIADPALRFWFRVYSPHRSRWSGYTAAERRRLLHEHAAGVFEDWCRSRVPGAQRFWEGDVELDLVAPDPTDAKRLLVAEVMWRKLSKLEHRRALAHLSETWKRCSLRHRHPRVRFEILDSGALGR